MASAFVKFLALIVVILLVGIISLLIANGVICFNCDTTYGPNPVIAEEEILLAQKFMTAIDSIR